MSTQRSSLAFIASMIVCSVTSAQSVDLQKICDTYAGRPLAMQGTSIVARSCDELRQFAARLHLRETTFAKARESFKSQAGLNISDAKEADFPEFMRCKILTSPTAPNITCTLSIFESKATMIYSGGVSGFIEKLIIVVDDTRSLLTPMIDGMDEKRGTRALPLLYDLLLDILIAKNNAIAPNEETYRRTKTGLSVTILNVYPR